MGSVAGPAGPGRPLRLLWLIDSLTAGGAESLLAQQARCVDGRRARLQVCCLKTLGTNPFEAELRDAGVAVTNLEARNLRDLAGYRRLETLVERGRPDVIHAHLNDASTWGALVARRTGVPLVATLHVFPDPAPALSRRGLRERLMARLVRRYAARIVAVSAAVVDAWSRQRGLERDAMEVVHNGVDVGRLDAAVDATVDAAVDATVDAAAAGTVKGAAGPSIRGELGLPPEAPVVLTVSVLRRGKGHAVLLGAIPTILEKTPEARFLFAGDGPLAEPLRRRAERLGVAERCHWLGFRDDLERLYALADLVVLPSDRPDALPTALIEAMASGTAFVASEVGGVPELVDASGAGVLVPPGDAAVLAGAVGDLLANPGRRREMGRRGRRYANAELSVDAWWERIEAVYTRALEEGPRATSALEDGPRATSAPAPKAVVVEFAGRGGMIHYAFQLCRALSRKGFEVVLATDRRYELAELPHPFRVERIFDTWDPKPPGRELSTGPFARLLRKLRRAPRALRYLRQWLALRRFVLRERPDLLQLGDLRFAIDLLGLRLLRPHVPLMVDVCHNVHPYAMGGRAGGGFRRSRIEEWLYTRIYRLFDRVLVHYPENRRTFLSTYDLEPERVGTLPLGNFEIFEELARDAHEDGIRTADGPRRDLGLDPGHRVVLLFGSLSRYKGIDDLLRAFVPVHRRFPEARLVVVGFPMHDFDLEPRRRLARRLGIDEAVRLVPRYVESEEVASWMELAEIAAFPHRAVYQSASLQTARTFGLPVVASDAGANAALVADGDNGLLVPAGDPEALSAALLRLLENPSLAARLGRRARQDAIRAGSWDRVAAAWLAECGFASPPADATSGGGRGGAAERKLRDGTTPAAETSGEKATAGAGSGTRTATGAGSGRRTATGEAIATGDRS